MYTSYHNNGSNGRLLAKIGKFLLQVLIFAVFAAVGAFIATRRIINNTTPFMQDLKNPVTLALFLGGAYIAALGFCAACLVGSKINTKRADGSKWDGSVLSFLGTFILQILVFGVFAVAGAYIATRKILNNSTPWLQDLKNPVALALLFAGFVLAAFGFCWACVIGVKYSVKHSIIGGNRMKFKSNAISLFINMVKWVALTVFTFGIYAFWVPVSIHKWVLENCVVGYNVDEVASVDYKVSYFVVDEYGTREEMKF